MKRLFLLAASACALWGQGSVDKVAPGTEKPVILYGGTGPWSHVIATRNPEAQKFFDQGLSLTYGFNRYEGLRSFRKAAELDPASPMVYWGMAMALGPYINMDGDPSFDIKESCEAAEKGLALKPAGAERDWLAATAVRCPDFSNPGAYIQAMKALAAKYPDDLDAQTLYADSLMIPTRWKWYSGSGEAAPGVTEAEHILEAVLRRSPNHAGANHLYIHAVESSLTPERAVPSAQRLMGIVPSEGHMVHMPGHIWLVTGDFEMAASVNERAVAADRKYFAQSGVSGSYYMYYLHNISFILYARSMQGRTGATMAAVKEIAVATAPMATMMPEMTAVFDGNNLLYELRMNRWDQLIAAPRPKPENPLLVTLWRYSRAVSYAMKGRREEARRERDEFEAARKGLDPKAPWGQNTTGAVMELASRILEARLSGSAVSSLPFWKHAVEMQDALIYDEPPAWYYPVRESLGAALLLAGDAVGAEAVFHEGLRKSPNNGRMLFGLLESLKAQGKADATREVQREFDRAWTGADLKLRAGEL